MNFIKAFRALLGSSLALRWVLYVTVAAGTGIAVLLSVAYTEMEYQVGTQGATVRELARQRTAERIDAEIELVEYRVATMFQDLERNLTGVATLRSTLGAIQHYNDVVITTEIGQRLVKAGFSGAIVVDFNLDVIGSDHTGAELVAANQALKMHELHATLRQFLDASSPSDRKAFRYVGSFDASYAAILLAPLQDTYGALFAVPVFDDFGEPIALVLAYRVFQNREASLTEFSDITKSKIALMVDGQPISVAGANIEQLAFYSGPYPGLLSVPEIQSSARCRASFRSLSICVMHADSEIERLSDQIMSIGREQFSKTRKTLTSIGGISVVLIMLLLIILVRRLTRPLSEITRAVDLVARGEWRVEVMHTNRLDEIGQIARAISAMQLSLAERDRMRQEMVRIDAINQRRFVLEKAVSRFEDGMAVVMKKISDTVHTLAASNEALDLAARQADVQAEKIRNTSVVTASRTTIASKTTIELSRTIREIGERVRNTGSVVHQSEVHVRAAEAKLGEVSSVAHEVEDAIAALQGFVADLGHLSLKASLEAVAAGEAGQKFSPLAQSVNALSCKAAEATEIITRELMRLSEIADGAYEEIGEVKDVLGNALRETREISVAVEEQDAATREIAEGLGNSASALISLADAVDQLRDSMSSAHEASTDFVLTARRIADDAKSIDGSIRTFVRDVVN
jgi:methyl-accepting chemotaxis protein